MMLEAYNQQCDEASRIFAEYQKRLQYYVDQAKNISSSSGIGTGEFDNPAGPVRNDAVYSTVKGNTPSDDIILVETTLEKNIRKACETLAAQMVEKISRIFPAYEGTGLHLNAQVDASKLGLDFDGAAPDDVKAIAIDSLKNPSLLLRAVTLYTSQVKTLLRKEIGKIDVKADAELLRFKYEDDRIVDVTSPDSSSQLKYQVYGSGKLESDFSTKGIWNQLLDKEKEHVQQFIATEDSLNKAAEAKGLSQKLIKRLHGNNDLAAPQPIAAGVISQNIGNTRHFELDVLAKEREAAGLRASVSTLLSEVQRLSTLCEERREAGEALKKKWKKIEEFDARRSELESIYSSLLEANSSASSFWRKQPSAAREYASKTIIPACDAVEVISIGAKDLIEKEVSSFSEALDNSLFMLPSTPQALLESMGVKGSSGPEVVAAAETNASLLITRAGAGDPSALPSICRISTALQSHSGFRCQDAALRSVLDALNFYLMPRASEASVLEELSKIINLVHTRRELVESDRLLLKHAHRLQQGYERKTNYCLNLTAEQERLITQRWLPELTDAVFNAQKGLEDCQRIRGLVDEWWEQPAATVVDWVLVDGQNVAAWLNHVRQLQMAFYDQKMM
ncbi:HAUS augmin-like complex subunit isoform X2 [Wolffia australiana]